MISADEALRIGLVNHVYEPAELLPAAEALAKKIIANAPLAVKFTMEAIDARSRNAAGEGRELAGAGLVSLQFLLIFPLPPDKKSVSFRLTLGANDRTLTADEVTRTRETRGRRTKIAGFELRE